MRVGLHVYSFTRPGRLEDADVQQVIANNPNVHNPDAIDLLVNEVMPRRGGSWSRR